jgi:eukaryotic-like serine/threonine-protein kinase
MAAGDRLLIADDDDGIRGLLTAFFTKKGFAVTGAADGPAALSLLKAGAVDVAIVDVMMPGMTGLQVLEEAREAGCTTPVIIATAHGDSDAVVQALELGADDWVAKPFDLAVLHARVLVRLRGARHGSSPPLTLPPTSSSTGPGDGDAPFVAAEGAILDGRYELQRPIGRGSFGVVWRARHRGLETDVAVKLLNIGEGGGTERLDPAKRQAVSTFEERSDELRLEGVRAARVQHPHAVRVLDVGALKDGTPYLVMELLQGPTVEDELRRQGAVDLLRAIEILVPVAEALAAAHAQGVIHRDVKPANVMLHRGAAGEIVKVLDFGVAKLVNVGVEGPGGHLAGASEVSSRVVAGSPAYIAPERLRGVPYDGRADVYSLGIMLYELLVGQVPFVSDDGDLMKVAVMHLKAKAAPPSQRNPALPAGVDATVARFLEKDPAQRPTALEAVDLLRDLTDFV